MNGHHGEDPIQNPAYRPAGTFSRKAALSLKIAICADGSPCKRGAWSVFAPSPELTIR